MPLIKNPFVMIIRGPSRGPSRGGGRRSVDSEERAVREEGRKDHPVRKEPVVLSPIKKAKKEEKKGKGTTKKRKKTKDTVVASKPEVETGEN